MRIQLVAFALIGLLARDAIAQSPAGQATPRTAIGTWRGTSRCLVHPSACRDELVVYRISALESADSVALDARKIVGGEEDPMGILPCAVATTSGQLTCQLPKGIWRFTVRGDSLTGELRLLDNSRYREVRTARDHDAPDSRQPR